MITIDKTDKLYAYLNKLGIDNIEKEYLELAQNGRYTRKEVQNYWYSDFQPSITNEIDENELEKLVDYYSNLKMLKNTNTANLNKAIKSYKQTNDYNDKELILNAKLKDILYLAVNYKSVHPDVNIQDVVQLANIGLIKALEKFKESNRIPFEDYIIYWVREEINKEIEYA